MRVFRRSGPPSTLIRVTVGVVLVSVLLWGMAGAVQRLSPGYMVWIDSLNASGGNSASTSYRQVESAVGQESVCGLAVGTSFQNHAGVIQPWVRNHAAADAWSLYQ